MNKSIKTPIYTLTCFLLLSACGGKPEQTNTDSTEKKPALNANSVILTAVQAKNAGLDTGRAQMRLMAGTLRVTGVIDVPPQNLVSISFPMGGYLKSTKLLPGMHVAKGETIAVMEDQQFIQLQQDYLTAQARLIAAEKEYNRQRDLNQSKASSDKVFEQAQADYQSQKVLVSALSQKLRLIGLNPERLSDGNITRSANIYSPINGFVSKVNVNIGKYVNPTDVLFEIVNPSDIHLALDVFEKDVNQLHSGQRVSAWMNSKPDQKYEAKIVLIGKDLGGDRKTVVHCHLEKYDHSLIPGTFMNAEIEVESGEGLTLPEEAVVNFENKYYVFRVKGKNTYEMQEVKTGLNKEGYVQLADENLKGVPVVTKGAYSLLMKLKNTGDEEE